MQVEENAYCLNATTIQADLLSGGLRRSLPKL